MTWPVSESISSSANELTDIENGCLDEYGNRKRDRNSLSEAQEIRNSWTTSVNSFARLGSCGPDGTRSEGFSQIAPDFRALVPSIDAAPRRAAPSYFRSVDLTIRF